MSLFRSLFSLGIYPEQMYLIDHPADYLPLWTALVLIVLYPVICILLEKYLKKQSFSKGKSRMIRSGYNILFVLLFFSAMEFTSAQVETIVNRSALYDYALMEMDLLRIWRPKRRNYQRDFGKEGMITLNSRGVRSTVEIPYKKEKNEYRILVLGDSWVFGKTVGDDATFCHLMEKALQERHPEKKITVINGGCIGYCLPQGYIMLVGEGCKYKPDMIIIKNFLNETGLKNFYQIHPLPVSPTVKTLKETLWKSRFYLYLRRLSLKQRYKTQNKTNENPEEPGYDQIKEYTRLVFGEYIDYCRKHNIVPVLLNLHLIDGIFYNSQMKDFARQESVPYIEVELDLTKDYKTQYNKGSHPGPLGHRKISERLVEYLLENNLLNRSDK